LIDQKSQQYVCWILIIIIIGCGSDEAFIDDVSKVDDNLINQSIPEGYQKVSAGDTFQEVKEGSNLVVVYDRNTNSIDGTVTNTLDFIIEVRIKIVYPPYFEEKHKLIHSYIGINEKKTSQYAFPDRHPSNHIDVCYILHEVIWHKDLHNNPLFG
jgi:prephenate dehydratase